MLRATRALAADSPPPADWSDRTLDSFLREAADRSPGQLALVEGDQRLTYRELLSAVRETAAGLAGLCGVAAGDVVCVMLPNWWETMIAMQAVLAIGAVVNPVIPIYRDHEMQFIFAQSGPRVVLIPHHFRGFDYVAMLQRLVNGMAEPPVVVVVRPQGSLPPGFTSWDQVASAPAPGLDDRKGQAAIGPGARRGPAAGDIALLLYTSGTTADPKGVLHSHQTLEYEDRSIIKLLGLTSTDTIFMPSPVTHITGFLYGIVMPAMLGVACVLLDVWEPSAARQLIEAEQCRFTLAATPFLVGLVQQYESGPGPCALRVFPCGGADVPPELVRRARKAMDTRVVRVYGSSEFPTFSCGGPDDDESVAAQTDGKPIGPVEMRLDDPVDGVGELLVRGPELFLGYLDADLNQRAFTEDGYFRTGDLASVGQDNSLTIRGRLKDIINRGGEKISAREVEDLIFEHPAVREVAVVGMPDPVLVERVSAFVVLEPGSSVTLPEIASYLRSRRIARQKVPERLTVVASLPKTASGKIQKFRLRTMQAGPGDLDASSARP